MHDRVYCGVSLPNIINASSNGRILNSGMWMNGTICNHLRQVYALNKYLWAALCQTHCYWLCGYTGAQEWNLLRQSILSILTKGKKGNREVICWLTWLWKPFHSVYVHQIITLHFKYMTFVNYTSIKLENKIQSKQVGRICRNKQTYLFGKKRQA